MPRGHNSTPRRDIIVIGGSAGGIEAGCELIEQLPHDLPAAILIVQHVGAASQLAEVLGRCGKFEVKAAADGEPIQAKKAYVAPGDRHILLKDGRIRLSRGPRENGQRPSVDALFRSASRAYRTRVIAVVLTGTLWDGAAGVIAVKHRGGVVIVQDPETALFRSMPENALRAVRADYCIPLSKIPELLVRLVKGRENMKKGNRKVPGVPKETREVQGRVAPFVCPECSGPLSPDNEGPPGQLRCLVGHSFAPESLSEAHREALERAVLTTMRLLQERAALHKHVALSRPRGQNGLRNRTRECAEAANRDVELLKDILERI